MGLDRAPIEFQTFCFFHVWLDPPRGGVRRNDYSITWGEGSLGTPKSDYVICARPLVKLIWRKMSIYVRNDGHMIYHHKSYFFLLIDIVLSRQILASQFARMLMRKESDEHSSPEH